MSYFQRHSVALYWHLSMYCVCNQVAQSEEKRVQWGAKQRRSMACKSEKPKIKPDVGNSAESMEDCEIIDSPRIITRSPVVLLKIDENEAMLVDSAFDGHKVSYISVKLFRFM